jgi:flagellar protein FliJ
VSAGKHDRGLHAVRRVREARERDSRIGLQQALAATRQREDEALQARRRLDHAPVFGTGTAAEFQSHVLLVRAIADTATEKQELARTSRTVADEARRRWALDRQALRTAETLLERRAEERLEDRARRHAAYLDELASQAWLRANTVPEEATR